MGRLTEEIIRLINSLQIDSASPGHINVVLQMDPSIDLDQALEEVLREKDDASEDFRDSSKTNTKEKDTGSIFRDLGKTEIKGKTDSFKKNFDNLSTADAKGVLSKAGISSKNLPGLLALSSGKGGLSFLTSVGGAAGLATFLGPVALALSIKPLTEAIIKELQRPGGFLDKRVKIDARNEAFAEIDRQTRQNTRIGDRQVIIQQFQGFRSFDGYASTNTSALIRENADRVLDIGLFDRAQGIPLGGR